MTTCMDKKKKKICFVCCSQILTSLFLCIFRAGVGCGVGGALGLSLWTRDRYKHACRQRFICRYLKGEKKEEKS